MAKYGTFITEIDEEISSLQSKLSELYSKKTGYTNPTKKLAELTFRNALIHDDASQRKWFSDTNWETNKLRSSYLEFSVKLFNIFSEFDKTEDLPFDVRYQIIYRLLIESGYLVDEK